MVNRGSTLALGAAAALAGLAVLGGRPAARRGGRNRGLSRQIPPGFSVSSYEAVRGTVLEESLDEWLDEEAEPGELPDPEERLYHVTTAADRVLAQGLKSRERLMAQRGSERSFGLGGGVSNQAPRFVSAAIRLSTARKIYLGLTTAVRAARGEISPALAARRVLEWSEFPDDGVWPGVRDEMDVSYDIWEEEQHEGLYSQREAPDTWDDRVGRLWHKVLGLPAHLLPRVVPTGSRWWWEALEANAETINEKWSRVPHGAYVLIQEMEKELKGIYDDAESHDWLPRESTVGFTEPGVRMARMDPGQIQILALAARGDAADVNPSEDEARFRPENVVVLGVVQ
jgi:hypothetical protein